SGALSESKIETGSASEAGYVRVGLVADIPRPTAGGAWTLVNGLVSALEAVESKHTFIWLRKTSHAKVLHAYGDERDKMFLRRARRSIRPRWLGDLLAKGVRRLIENADPQAELEQSIRSQVIDIVWFVTPPGMVLSSPFITVVWDLEHRLRPYFPEVS